MRSNFWTRNTYVRLFMSMSCRTYHYTVLKVPPQRFWIFKPLFSISHLIHFHLLPLLHFITQIYYVTSLPFRIHIFFHPYFIFSSFRQVIYRRLSFTFICLLIYTHTLVSFNHEQLSHTSFPVCIGSGASRLQDCYPVLKRLATGSLGG